MCRPKDNNPLLAALLAKRINPLKFARAESPLGTLYAIEKRDRSAQIALRPEIAFVDWPGVNERALTTGTRGIQEDSLSSNFSFEGGLAALGRAIVGVGSVEAKLRALGVKGFHVKVERLEGRRLDLNQVVPALASARVSPAFVMQVEGKDLFLTTGAWAARRIVVQAMDEKKRGVDISAQLQQIDLGLRTDITSGEYGRVYIASEVPLYFGAELMKLENIVGGYRLKDFQPRAVVADDSQDHIDRALADIWAQDDLVDLEIAQD